MSDIHIMKLTEQEAVIKIYTTSATGATENISLETQLTRPNEVFVPGTSSACIKSIHWGTKANKQLDISRVVSGVEEGHYYLSNAGFYEFHGFVDSTYATSDIRVTGDGPHHVIIVLSKRGWLNKIEDRFGSYDNINAVGS